MRKIRLGFLVFGLISIPSIDLQAQAPAVPGFTAPSVPPVVSDPKKIVAVANGASINQLALDRALDRFPEEKRPEMRQEVLDFLVDNILIEQYLVQIKVEVMQQDLASRIVAMTEEAKKEGKEFSKILIELKLDEVELRQHLTAELRWEKFLEKQSTPMVLRQMFEGNKDFFDGTTVRARHILLNTKEGSSPEIAKEVALGIRADLEKEVAAGLAKLPTGTDNLTREKMRIQLLDQAFAKQAAEKSICPSKAQGGDVGFFAREGAMIEPFSKAAFALQPYQLSDPVMTQFGCHLILPLEKKPGKEVKLDEVKEEVKEYYSEKLREHLATHLRKSAKIQLTQAPAAVPPATTPTSPVKPTGGQ